MDFPAPSPTPQFISSYSRFMSGWELARTGGVIAPAAGAWPTASTALYIPFWVPWNYPVRRMFWANGTAVAGNYDIGIYRPNGTRLASAGSTAASGTTAPQYVSLSSPLLLTPGNYYLGFVHDAITAAHVVGATVTANRLRMAGVLQQATALPLPTPATFAASTLTFFPYAGITRTASGF